ncbi:MAG: hypothetical protein FWE51_04435, partial [Coriobacteriia bacterium]|nr:hypothetical protein [Coriobacteriia bacterium]
HCWCCGHHAPVPNGTGPVTGALRPKGKISEQGVATPSLRALCTCAYGTGPVTGALRPKGKTNSAVAPPSS